MSKEKTDSGVALSPESASKVYGEIYHSAVRNGHSDKFAKILAESFSGTEQPHTNGQSVSDRPS